MLADAGLVAPVADVREQVARDLLAVDPAEWALAGQHAGEDAARIARGETKEAADDTQPAHVILSERDALVQARAAYPFDGDPTSDVLAAREAFIRGFMCAAGAMRAVEERDEIVLNIEGGRS